MFSTPNFKIIIFISGANKYLLMGVSIGLKESDTQARLEEI
jgi:hypothetical protein